MPKPSNVKDQSKSPKKRATKTKQTQPGRKVVYTEISVKVCTGPDALTCQQAKELLDWEEESSKVKFGTGHIHEIAPLYGCKVRCRNNVANRPIYPNVLRALKQEILRRRWRLNLENIIIGRTGQVLNGQHRLISLVLAAKEHQQHPEQWADYWQTEPTIETSIGFGTDESDDVVNTMDTCKPRSLADVIYRSRYFADWTYRPRRIASRMLDHAVRIVWHRTGAGADAFAVRRTHSEALHFIERHPRLLECVKHVYEEDGSDKRITAYLTPGYAAGLLYLMGSAASHTDTYHHAASPNEELLNWDLWQRACDYFVVLAGAGPETAALRTARAELLQVADGARNAERWALVIKGWLCYAADKPITQQRVKLQYTTDQDGYAILTECPTTGGIDLGSPSRNMATPRTDPTPEQIQERAAGLRKAKSGQQLKQVGHRSGKQWAKGDTAWVVDSEGQHYYGTLADKPYDCKAPDSPHVMITATDGEWEVAVADLRLRHPTTETPKTSIQAQPSAGHKGKRKRSGHAQTARPQVGQLWWVDPGADAEPWRGKILDLLGGQRVRLCVAQGFQGAGNVLVARLPQLSYTQPGERELA